MGIIFGKVDVAQPGFEVLHKCTGYEVRKMVTYCVAEVSGSGTSQRDFGNQHFRTLAQYIGVFGQPNNRKKEAMDMTAPVLMSTSPDQPERMDMTAPVLASASGGQFCMSFVLPLHYSAENAPVPNDSRIQLRQIPARTVAVHTFSGNPSDEVVNEKASWLLHQVQQDGFKLAAEPQDAFRRGWELARYNPPFTIPCLKTNEIQVQLE